MHDILHEWIDTILVMIAGVVWLVRLEMRVKFLDEKVKEQKTITEVCKEHRLVNDEKIFDSLEAIRIAIAELKTQMKILNNGGSRRPTTGGGG